MLSHAPDFSTHRTIQPRVVALKQLSYFVSTQVMSCGVDGGISC